MGISSIARGGLFLFIGSVVASILGYVYWFILSIFGGAEVVGTANSVLSLSSLVSGVAILGVPTGVQRFLGREFGNKNVRNLNTYFWSSFAFTLALCLLSAIIIWVVMFLNIPFIGFSEGMLFLAGIIVSLSFSGVMSALFASIIRTEYAAISYVVSAIAKVSFGVFLVYIGVGWVGAVVGIVIAFFSLVGLMLYFAMKELRRIGDIEMGISLKALQESLRAGIASWLPGVVALLGQQLSILTVFALRGGFEAGIFFIAYAIFSIVYMLPTSFMSILLPALSGLADEASSVAWKALKLCLAMVSPFAVFLIFYSAFPLSIMGADYIQAAPTLSILALSMIPSTFVLAVTNLVYALGHYGKTLGIGLAVNVPQVALNLLLVPIYGGFGAALPFLIGAFVGLAAAIWVSKMVGFTISSRRIMTTVTVPFLAAALCFLFGLNWFVGGIVILLTSVFCYGRLGVIDRSDLAEIARAFASEKTIAKAGSKLNWILRIIYGE